MATIINTASNPSGERLLSRRAAFAVPVALAAAPAAALAAPQTPVAAAYAALKEVQGREQQANKGGDEATGAWCDQDTHAVWALAKAKPETPQDVLKKLRVVLRRGPEVDWLLMDCEADCLERATAELERFFPGLPA